MNNRFLANRLYEVMSCEIGVMAEWGDDPTGLMRELMTCDREILMEYVAMYLVSE